MKIRCIQCQEVFDCETESYWDENGYGYSTKLCRCKNCGQLNIVKIEEDKWLDVNNDERYYE